MLATANTGKSGEMLLKNAGEWAGRVETSILKKSLVVGKTCLAVF